MVRLKEWMYIYNACFFIDSRAEQYLSLSQGAAISALIQMESVRERKRGREGEGRGMKEIYRN